MDNFEDLLTSETFKELIANSTVKADESTASLDKADVSSFVEEDFEEEVTPVKRRVQKIVIEIPIDDDDEVEEEPKLEEMVDIKEMSSFSNPITTKRLNVKSLFKDDTFQSTTVVRSKTVKATNIDLRSLRKVSQRKVVEQEME